MLWIKHIVNRMPLCTRTTNDWMFFLCVSYLLLLLPMIFNDKKSAIKIETLRTKNAHLLFSFTMSLFAGTPDNGGHMVQRHSVYIHIRLYTFTYTHTHIRLYTFTYTHTFAYTHSLIHTYIRLYTFTYTRTHTHSLIHTHTVTYTHTLTHTHTHIPILKSKPIQQITATDFLLVKHFSEKTKHSLTHSVIKIPS